MGAEELARRVEDMAARLGGSSGRNTLSLSGEFLSQSFEEGLELMVQVMLRPDFPADEVAKRKADQLAAIKAKEEQPASVAFRLFAENMYQGHPYARDPLGTAASLERLDRDRLKALHKATVRSENLVLAVVGDVNAEKVKKKLSELLAPLSRGFNPVWPDLPPPLPEGGLSVREPRPGQAQTHTLLGFRGASMKEPKSYALDLLAEALANQSGRLFVDLRDQKSLAYALTAFNSAGYDLGSFGFYVAHAPEKAGQVREELIKQVEKIKAQGLTEKELIGARARLLAQWILDRQSFGDRARDLALYDRLGLGWDYAARYGQAIKDLTAQEVLDGAREYLDLTRPLWITVGPEEERGD
jgi:zinc protease